MNRRVLVVVLAAAIAVAAAVPAIGLRSSERGRDDVDGGRWGERREEFVERLAAELDLPVERVERALRDVSASLREEWRDRRLSRLRTRLDAAVENGDLTREQAEAVMEAAEAGVFDGGGGWGMGGGPRRWSHGFGRAGEDDQG